MLKNSTRMLVLHTHINRVDWESFSKSLCVWSGRLSSILSKHITQRSMAKYRVMCVLHKYATVTLGLIPFQLLLHFQMKCHLFHNIGLCNSSCNACNRYGTRKGFVLQVWPWIHGRKDMQCLLQHICQIYMHYFRQLCIEDHTFVWSMRYNTCSAGHISSCQWDQWIPEWKKVTLRQLLFHKANHCDMWQFIWNCCRKKAKCQRSPSWKHSRTNYHCYRLWFVHLAALGTAVLTRSNTFCFFCQIAGE